MDFEAGNLQELATGWGVEHLPAEALLAAQQRVLAHVARNSPLAESLAEIARFAEACIPGMFGSILYYDHRAGCLRRGGYGKLPESFAAIVDGLVPGPASGSCGTCAYRAERVISEDVFTDPLWNGFHELCREYSIRSAWSTPLKSSRDGALLGVFGMYHPEVRVPSAADLQLVDHFVHLAAIATERHRDERERIRAAEHDPLTDLGNRRLLETAGSGLLARHRAAGTPLCLAFIDLDNFKAFNDAFGHHAGDSLLRGVCDRLRATLADAELHVRYGGDELLVFLPFSLEEAEERIVALQAVLREPLAVGDTAPKITASCGIVQIDGTTLDLEACVAQADEASRQAKALGGDRCVVLDEAQSTEVLRRRRMLRDLEQAINDGLVEPYFQPVVNLVSGQPRGFEVLFRTSAPGLQEASVFDCIVMAEDSGLIHRLGLGVLRFAMESQVMHRDALAGMSLGVNVSVLQLVRRDFADAVASALAETGAEAAGIYLEVTESQWLDTGGPARDTLARLKQMGFRLALDDFGTGYASLAYLQALPLDAIKIDRRFVSAIADGGGRDASLCRALLAMGHATGLMVVAEGVETRAQAGALSALGFDRAQGFLWSEPMPLPVALDWLAQQRTR
ncbi:MAG: hypothetical protein RJB26_1910 [Pseudomonadota bacterium]